MTGILIFLSVAAFAQAAFLKRIHREQLGHYVVYDETREEAPGTFPAVLMMHGVEACPKGQQILSQHACAAAFGAIVKRYGYEAAQSQALLGSWHFVPKGCSVSEGKAYFNTEDFQRTLPPADTSRFNAVCGEATYRISQRSKFCTGGELYNGGGAQPADSFRSESTCRQTCDQDPRCKFFMWKHEPGTSWAYHCATFTNCNKPDAYEDGKTSIVFQKLTQTIPSTDNVALKLVAEGGQAGCNPTFCSTGVVCHNHPFECRTQGTCDDAGGVKYCAHGKVLCANGHCASSLSACSLHGGIKFSAQACPASCNPSPCASGLVCSNEPTRCCEKGDWNCCGATEMHRYSNRLYCPSEDKSNTMCRDGHCFADAGSCQTHGGVKFISKPCQAEAAKEGTAGSITLQAELPGAAEKAFGNSVSRMLKIRRWRASVGLTRPDLIDHDHVIDKKHWLTGEAHGGTHADMPPKVGELKPSSVGELNRSNLPSPVFMKPPDYKVGARIKKWTAPTKRKGPITIEGTIHTTKDVMKNDTEIFRAMQIGLATALEVTVSAVQVHPRMRHLGHKKKLLLDFTLTLPIDFWPFAFVDVQGFIDKKFPLPGDAPEKKRAFLRKMEGAVQKYLGRLPSGKPQTIQFSRFELPFHRWQEHKHETCPDTHGKTLPGVHQLNKKYCQAYCEETSSCQFYCFGSHTHEEADCKMYSKCGTLKSQTKGAYKCYEKPKLNNWQPANFVNTPKKLGPAYSEAQCQAMCKSTGAAACAYSCDGCFASTNSPALTAVPHKTNHQCSQSALSLKKGAIKITILKAQDLRKADNSKHSDPYVSCWVPGGDSFKTATAKDTHLPEWDTSHTFADFDFGNTLHFTVWDEDKVTHKAPGLLGRATVKPWMLTEKILETNLTLEYAHQDDVLSDLHRVRPAILTVRVEMVPVRNWFECESDNATVKLVWTETGGITLTKMGPVADFMGKLRQAPRDYQGKWQMKKD